MKITIIQGAFLPVPAILGGAVEKRWFALSKDFAKKGHEVVHISRRYSGLASEEKIEGVLHKRVTGFDTPKSGLRLKLLDFLYTCYAKKVIPADTDVIVTNTFWAPILLRSELKKRCIVDVARMPKGQLKFYRQVARFRANSLPVGEAIKKELPESTEKKIVVIPNPLPFENSSHISLDNKTEMILYTGRVHPEKGLELLIKAFNNLTTNWQLIIVGPSDVKAGGGGPEYLNSLKKLSEGKNVSFPGPIYDIPKLNELYIKASIFVYPSIAEQGETFGLAPLEAMSWGCVPIVSDLKCFKDFITDGKNGVVFDHRSKDVIPLLTRSIKQLQNNLQERVVIAKEAFKVRETHSTSRIADLFLREFESVLSEKN